MEMPLFAFAPPLVGAFTLFVLFSYLWAIHRERYLGLWTMAWALWVLRLAYASFAGGMGVVGLDPIPRILAVAYTSLVLLGAADFAGRRVLRTWLLLAVPALVLRILPLASPELEPFRLSVWGLVLGLGWAWAGVLFGRSGPELGRERWIPSVALVLMGLHQASIPVAARIEGYEPWALNLTLALQIGIGVGVLVAFGHRQRSELRETHARLEQALTRVLGDFVPICAQCKSIRTDTNEWQPLEHYLGEHVSLSHGVCPDCELELYPEYAQGRAPRADAKGKRGTG
ncbi:MAG: hypothetical protein P8188_02950 [Gemmatimonadota bacterium]|jgi:hypothetical protein